MSKYNKLTKDLIEASAASTEAGKGEDGGTANLDSVFLRLPNWREEKVIEAIKRAGLYCIGKTQWIGEGYMISPICCGQGNSRARAMQAMKKVLTDKGYDVLSYYQMD
ncbi:hypothetical protein SAMN05444401_3568 [Clostridium amylolyticum]|uniref:Uncharacterized protein n=1 Tax=Clostridium amylolyticum TaxID=1121298 RepID=A0A1M6L147_9CLOT|nr:hypothetical protein [Clostridium amylolyticum]SHJ64883.1 hypothetical protein SAMN05444401_3568 [Clostridium amylolyticum]